MSEEITLTKEKLKEIINECFTHGEITALLRKANIIDIKPFSKNEYLEKIIKECENPQYTNERNEK